ncbi:ABC-2 type transport system permease protein [Paenibacillus sp. UNCCL117]|uniref:ABC transporter permease n=1 Tax=unclassified Paenibacillus TaxID=185978 RepID=UPI0008886469|nr:MULTISPECIES: ABC transporter permease [unclassified Paenibacillus]SDD61640.1 ABC-2 type transport system permease protein [Paenibacillus sp. cl123]SFW67539.1 ABC-2 type transport system permease protein [Paenibacillus sp. UNCCL117]
MSKPEPLTFDAGRLWSKRERAFLAEIKPYVGYALQTVSLLIVLGMLAMTYLYGKLLVMAPPGFPFREIITLVLLPILALSPIRTYLREPDLVFWIPLESELVRGYMTKAVNRAWAWQTIGVLIVWLAVWPAYAFSEGDKPGFLHALLVLIAIKRILLQARWLEAALLASKPARIVWSLSRWLAAGSLTYALLTLRPWVGTLIVAAALLLYVGLIRLSTVRTLQWLRLVDTERKHRRAILQLLNQFVDVSDMQGRPRSVHAPRKLMERLGGFRFQTAHTYRFLYAYVWLRSEIFGIALRLSILGFLIIAFTRGFLVPTLVFLVFAALLALQLKELTKAYRHSDWSFIYPLPPQLRASSAASVVRSIHAAAVALLAVPLLWALPAFYYAFVLLAAGWGLTLLLCRVRTSAEI